MKMNYPQNPYYNYIKNILIKIINIFYIQVFPSSKQSLSVITHGNRHPLSDIMK